MSDNYFEICPVYDSVEIRQNKQRRIKQIKKIVMSANGKETNEFLYFDQNGRLLKDSLIDEVKTYAYNDLGLLTGQRTKSNNGVKTYEWKFTNTGILTLFNYRSSACSFSVRFDLKKNSTNTIQKKGNGQLISKQIDFFDTSWVHMFLGTIKYNGIGKEIENSFRPKKISNEVIIDHIYLGEDNGESQLYRMRAGTSNDQERWASGNRKEIITTYYDMSGELAKETTRIFGKSERLESTKTIYFKRVMKTEPLQLPEKDYYIEEDEDKTTTVDYTYNEFNELLSWVEKEGKEELIRATLESKLNGEGFIIEQKEMRGVQLISTTKFEYLFYK